MVEGGEEGKKKTERRGGENGKNDANHNVHYVVNECLACAIHIVPRLSVNAKLMVYPEEINRL